MEAANYTPADLRRVLGAFATGVTVITTVDSAGRRYGVTANSFNSLSIDPPLVLWSQASGAPSHPAFRSALYFAVNVLSVQQEALSRKFATPAEDKFRDVELHEGMGGVPLLAGAIAWIECAREAVYPGGDHALFIGRVLRLTRQEAAEPLVFWGGQYRRLAQGLPRAA